MSRPIVAEFNDSDTRLLSCMDSPNTRKKCDERRAIQLRIGDARRELSAEFEIRYQVCLISRAMQKSSFKGLISTFRKFKNVSIAVAFIG